MLETPVIEYNLKERGRKFRGQERNFNLKKIANAINGPATQERVKHRDMVGFYGHWPRIRFGLNPAEGGIAEGKAQAVEPALVTVMLEANPDGTVKHQSEFLDTNAGRIAAGLFQEKVGGFSSAIDEVKPEFYGFDYVLEPNYSTNRGYAIAMDSINAGNMTLDYVMDMEYQDQVRAALVLLDSVNKIYQMSLESHAALSDDYRRLEEENAELMSLLTAKNGQKIIMDSTGDITMPMAVSTAEVDRIMRTAEMFKSVRLPRIVEPSKEVVPTLGVTAFFNRLRRGR